MVHAARKTLEEAGEHATDDDRSAIEAAITEAEEAIQGDDAAAMEAATTKLTEATGGVAQKMYAAQQAQDASAGGEACGGLSQSLIREMLSTLSSRKSRTTSVLNGSSPFRIGMF